LRANSHTNADAIAAPSFTYTSSIFTDTNAERDNYTYTYSNSNAWFIQHIWRCHLLLKSEPSPSARCDDDPDW
jgi:hypothetical protein